MKNIQVVDGADNCTFSIFEITDGEFSAIFSGEGQDMEFAEDLFARLGEANADALLKPIWERPVRKPGAQGIHGTLFYGFEAKRKLFPATKREKDWDPTSLNAAQRKLYGAGAQVS